jgi:hypothetical protein
MLHLLRHLYFVHRVRELLIESRWTRLACIDKLYMSLMTFRLIWSTKRWRENRLKSEACQDFLRVFFITLYFLVPGIYISIPGLYLFTAGDWDVHGVSHSPRTLMMQGEWMTQGKAIFFFLNPSRAWWYISLIGHLHLESIKDKIVKKHSYGDILEPHSTFQALFKHWANFNFVWLLLINHVIWICTFVH